MTGALCVGYRWGAVPPAVGTGHRANIVKSTNGVLTQAVPPPVPLSGQLGTFREVSQEDASRCHPQGHPQGQEA